MSTRYIAGTLKGQDGLDINAQISLDIKDRNNVTIGLDGCRAAGYSKTIWMNINVGGAGTVHTAYTQNTWRLNNLPANAVSAWIEVWTRTSMGKLCPTCDGVVNTKKYGFINRRAVALNRSYRLIAPMNCGWGIGTSGNIQGRLMNSAGAPVKFDKIYAWSELTPDGILPMQGWGTAIQSLGYYKLDNLASGQNYVVWATYRGKTVKRFHIPVRACKSVPLAFKI